MDFPERLRSLRKEAQLSQRDLAERIGVDFTYLSKIENGRVEPPSEAVLKGVARELAGELRPKRDRTGRRTDNLWLGRSPQTWRIRSPEIQALSSI